MTPEIAILAIVRRAGSGTPEAELAVRRLTERSTRAVLAVVRLISRGWLLYADGEPAALTVPGLRALSRADITP